MKITIYGTRGSYPVCRADTIRYGGNTTCLLIEEKNNKIIVDGGTGIINLGKYLQRHKRYRENKISIMVTHTHWDHIMGMPFFMPFYFKGAAITIYGADSETMTLHDTIVHQLDGQYNFPVFFDELAADINFKSLSGGDHLNLNEIKISTYQLNHSGVDLGYRFETESGTFVFLTDLAPIESNHLGMGMENAAGENPAAFEQDYFSGLVEFVRGADLVMHDTNFSEEEMKAKRHWGHSSSEDALKLVSNLNEPPAITLAHHDPNHSDTDMDEIYKSAKQKGRQVNIEVLIAKERGEFIL